MNIAKEKTKQNYFFSLSASAYQAPPQKLIYFEKRPLTYKLKDITEQINQNAMIFLRFSQTQKMKVHDTAQSLSSKTSRKFDLYYKV